MKDPRDIILAPVVSEKSYALMETGVYTFKVHPSASKPEIRDAVEAIWGVEVRKVNTLNRKGKKRRTRGTNRVGSTSLTRSGPSSPWQRARSRCSRTEDAMGIRSRKPTSPARRFQTVSDFSEITKSKPEKSLLAPKPKTGGRNSYGRKTSRHRGGGHKQQYRIVDFKRVKDGVTAKVAAIEYDPNRTCRIALLHYADGQKAYILAPRGLHVGDHVMSGQGSDIKPGNALPLRYIPVGTVVHNVELRPGQGGKMGRSAGTAVQLVAKDGDFATLRMPSTEMRRVLIDCRATVGEVGNSEHELIKIGKAGRNRWKGVRPQTRGVAMNPVDHPLGGGEGRTSGGRPAVSPWGQPEGRTRDKNKPSQSLIVRRRRTGKGRR